MFTRDSIIISHNIETPLTSISRAVGNILQLTFNAPYNLAVEFKMTNRLELTWKLDGFVDEQRYYCSETPIDLLNLPVPKAVLAGDVRSYTDSAIEAGKTYYVCVGSVKDGTEKVGQVKIRSAEKLLIFLPLTVDASDHGSIGVSWVNDGGVTFDSNGAYFSKHPQSLYQTTHAINFNKNFKMSYEVKRTDSNTAYAHVFNNDNLGNWPVGSFGSAFAGDNALSMYANRMMLGVSGVYDVGSSATFGNNTFYKVEIEKVSGVITMKVDGVTVISGTDSTSSIKNFLRLGLSPSNGITGQFKGYIRNFKVYDLT